jgi:hypothetical protein
MVMPTHGTNQLTALLAHLVDQLSHGGKKKEATHALTVFGMRASAQSIPHVHSRPPHAKPLLHSTSVLTLQQLLT